MLLKSMRGAYLSSSEELSQARPNIPFELTGTDGMGNAVETTSDFVARESRRWEVATSERKPWAEVTLPDERAGTVMVYRTFERLSYALVMKATRAMHVDDIVKNP